MDVKILIAHLSCGPLMVILTYIFYKFPPKKINPLYGYRTNRSMQNQKVWDFANKVSTKYLLVASLITSLVQAIIILMKYHIGKNASNCVLFFCFRISLQVRKKIPTRTFEKQPNSRKQIVQSKTSEMAFVPWFVG